MMTEDQTLDPQGWWEDFYRTRRTSTSGRPSAMMLRFATGLAPGRALDLGASHGDDVLWLAARGWEALGLDISPTAVGRAEARAAEAGLAGRARFEARDLEAGLPEGRFDLVTALYFQSPVTPFPRAQILRAAAALVPPGGHLLVVAHAAPPPWASGKHGGDFPTVESERADLAADPALWDEVVADVVARPGTGPEGEAAELLDTVLFLKRRSA
ncbi:class I SAM-dependent methyltransferase [Pseudoroseicyclus sp. CXY001]|uniref:class I SAM-dependent methyltransferase n=1 Tax=Pseudoroseicyclus sp. CXY001 TaxID=3242492 RepID=UPI003571248F